MRVNPIFGVAFAGLLAGLGGCSGQQPANPAEFKILNPGPVIKDQGNPLSLKGRFAAVPDPSGSGIEGRSHGSGGACIVGDLAKHGAPEKSCVKNTECNDALQQYRQDNPTNPNIQAISTGGGYCIAKRCWYRPSGNACVRKSFTDGTWSVGAHEIGPIQINHIAALYGADAVIDWQVVTCANRAKADGTDAGVIGGVSEPGACSASQGIYLPPPT